MNLSQLRVARVSPGLTWRAFDAGQAVGSVRALLRPDNRWIVWFDECRDDSYAPLILAVADDVRADLYVMAEEDDPAAQHRLAALGFAERRREGYFVMPTDPKVTGLDGLVLGDDVVIISAADVDEDDLRLLDMALREDVPGSDGWVWDPGDFRQETYESRSFDPATYMVAVDLDSGRYIGLARVWMDPGRPRLGLVAVLPPYRRRRIARTLLGKTFAAVHQRGRPEVTAEIDDTNTASLALLTGIGARKSGGTIEYLRPRSASEQT